MPITKQNLNDVDFVYENTAKGMIHKIKKDLMMIISRNPSLKSTSFTFTFELYQMILVQKLIQLAKHEFMNIVEETITQYYDLHDQRDFIFVRLNFNWDLLNEAFIMHYSSEEEQD